MNVNLKGDSPERFIWEEIDMIYGWKREFYFWLIASKMSIGNYTVFLVQFGNNLPECVFQKSQIALAEVAHAISDFWKTH